MRVVIGLIALAGVALLIRSTALTVLASHHHIVIDVLVFATLIWALKFGESGGATFGFILGLAADIDAAHWLGRHALMLSLIGYAVGRLSRTIVRDSARTQLVLIFLVTLVHQTWSLLFEMGGKDFAGWRFLVVHVLQAAVTTAPVGVMVLALMRFGSGQPLFGHAALQSGPRT